MSYTIAELEKRYYGQFAGEEFSLDITKQDDPLLTSTPGAFDSLFGNAVWLQSNRQVNTYGALPKTVYEKDGWRVNVKQPSTYRDGGTAENANIGDTEKGDYQKLSHTLKVHENSFEFTLQQEIRQKSNEGVEKEQIRADTASIHMKRMNQALLLDVSAQAAAATGDYAGSDTLETIDRVISSDSEEDVFGGTHNGYFDIFGADRDSGTTFDSYVDHNSGTDRALTERMVNMLVQTLGSNGALPNFFITGYDTENAWIELFTTRVEYNVFNKAKMSGSVGGIKTMEGHEFGHTVMMFRGLPIIQDNDVTKDTISRIYALNVDSENGKPNLSLDIGMPTTYKEKAYTDKDGVFVNDKFNTRGLFATAGEIKCHRLDLQGKIRDLQFS